MDSWEWNKIAGAVLGTLLFVVALKVGSEFLFEVQEPAKPGYVVPGVAQAPAPGPAPTQTAEAVPDFGTVLPKADVAHGQQVSQRCQQCHDLAKGGSDKIGPNLWGIVSRPRASRTSFSYSSAMSASHDPWTFDKLFVYLKSPATMVPGTKMSFAGLSSDQDRLDLLAYLRTLSDSPAPIPPPQAAKPAAASPTATPAAAPSQSATATPAPAPAKSVTATPAAAPSKFTTAAPAPSKSATATPAAAPSKFTTAAPAPSKSATATPAAAPSKSTTAAPAPSAAPASSGPQTPDFATAIPAADVAAGKDTAQQCQMCHDLSKGGPDKIGPNLWGIVNRPRASGAGFSYSTAMSANHDPWTYDKLFAYLESPQTMVPGTKMGFAGIKSTQQRVNLIAYLRTLADKPAPLPAGAAKGK